MTALSALAKRSLLPSLASELLDTSSFFSPSIWDMDGEFFDLNLSGRVPSVNVLENTKDFKIEMAAPGLEKKDFKVEVDHGILTISTEKKEETKEEKENYTRREYSYNSFSRSLRLPDNCLPDKIDAKYENGVLHIAIPKKEIAAGKPAKQIKVS